MTSTTNSINPSPSKLPKTITRKNGLPRKSDVEISLFSKQLMGYAEKCLSPDEANIYKQMMTSISGQFNIDDVHELMMLDLAVHDFLRAKRMQEWIQEKGDIVTIPTKFGNVDKTNEAHYLMNAIESQFRQNMKELLLTRKEDATRKLGAEDKDFSTVMAGIKSISVKEADIVEKEEKVKEKITRGAQDIIIADIFGDDVEKAGQP